MRRVSAAVRAASVRASAACSACRALSSDWPRSAHAAVVMIAIVHKKAVRPVASARATYLSGASGCHDASDSATTANATSTASVWAIFAEKRAPAQVRGSSTRNSSRICVKMTNAMTTVITVTTIWAIASARRGLS